MLKYKNIIYFEKVDHMQIKIKIIFLKERFFCNFFLWKGIDTFNTEKNILRVGHNFKY
jgi:hypothetical protein